VLVVVACVGPSRVKARSDLAFGLLFPSLSYFVGFVLAFFFPFRLMDF
jgi:hypothetical protein